MRPHEVEFQAIIQYEFRDISLLRQALTHSSYANECRNKAFKDNERLEFLGDAVLEIVTSEYLFRTYPDKPEGEMSRNRASIVCEQTLDLCAKPLGLSDYLYLGKGEDATGGRKRPSILSDALEAVIGAIYLDGGFSEAQTFVHRFILNDVEHKQLYSDCKTKIQEYAQAHKLGNPDYRLTGSEGPDHNKTFFVDLYLKDEKISSASGHSKKAAEQQAAYKALTKLKDI